jgi:5-methylcytosine-specific restriction endonuclease McrA
VARSPHCYWCKRAWTKTRRPTHDHIVPLSKGGANTVENSVCACRDCNSRKGAGRFNPNDGQGILI